MSCIIKCGSTSKPLNLGVTDIAGGKADITLTVVNGDGTTIGSQAILANAQDALISIDAAITTLSEKRGDIGAYMNRLSYASANLASTIENVQAAEDVKFIMIDPKRIELSSYDGIPHLISPVVTDVKKATNALFWAIHEMEKRYEMLSEKKSKKYKSV